MTGSSSSAAIPFGPGGGPPSDTGCPATYRTGQCAPVGCWGSQQFLARSSSRPLVSLPLVPVRRTLHHPFRPPRCSRDRSPSRTRVPAGVKGSTSRPAGTRVGVPIRAPRRDFPRRRRRCDCKTQGDEWVRRDGYLLLVHYRDDGDEATTHMGFPGFMESELETARAAFDRRDIPIETEGEGRVTIME